MWFQGLAHFVKALTLPPPGTTAAAKTLALAIRTDAKIPEQTGHLRLFKNPRYCVQAVMVLSLFCFMWLFSPILKRLADLCSLVKAHSVWVSPLNQCAEGRR